MPDCVESMAYFGQVPWHGKGTQVDHAMTAAEAIALGGMDWAVSMRPVELAGVPVPGYSWTVRDDTGAPLGLVGANYHPIQNTELFTFFDPLVNREEGTFFHTVGVLKGGKRVWLLAKIPGDFYVVKDDRVGNYLLIASSHDGSLELSIFHTPIRVVCNNTLSAALTAAEDYTLPIVRIRHTAGASERIKLAHQALGLATKRVEVMAALYQRFARVKLGVLQFKEYLQHVVPSSKEERSGIPSAMIQEARDTIERLYDAGINNLDPDFTHTAWSALNATTHYLDHSRQMRRGSDRLESSWFGTGRDMRDRAVSWLRKLV